MLFTVPFLAAGVGKTDAAAGGVAVSGAWAATGAAFGLACAASLPAGVSLEQAVTSRKEVINKIFSEDAEARGILNMIDRLGLEDGKGFVKK